MPPAGQPRSRLATAAHRLGRALLWCFLVGAAVELGMRATGWCLLRARARETQARLPPDAYRLLFIGESTTYGFGVKPDESYPAQVARLLEAKHPGRHFVVFNRGVPGITTTAMARSLTEKLTLLLPHVVLLLVGANDFHTQYNGLRVPGEGWLPRPISNFVSELRIYRALDLWLELRKPKMGLSRGRWLDARSPAGISLEQAELYYDLGSGHHLLYPRTAADDAAAAPLAAKLEANVERMIQKIRAAGAQPVLIGYLRQPRENRMLAACARRMGVPFVATWPDTPDDSLARPPDLFTADGFHPSPTGHRLMAERVVDSIDALVGTP